MLLARLRAQVGYVPVQISISIELNGAAWADRELEAEFTAGVEVSAYARMGLQWDEENQWRKSRPRTPLLLHPLTTPSYHACSNAPLRRLM